MEKLHLIQIIQKLQSKNHDIKYRKRSDGGYIITSIDGVKYKGAKGNQRARNLVGEHLSSKRRTALSELTKRHKSKHKKLDEDLMKKVKKAQRVWNKNQVKAKGGRVGMKKFRWRLANYGEEEAVRSLERAELYAMGYAYPENVDALADRLERFVIVVDDYYAQAFQEYANKIRARREHFKETDLQKINEIMYATEQRIGEGDDSIIEETLSDISQILATTQKQPSKYSKSLRLSKVTRRSSSYIKF